MTLSCTEFISTLVLHAQLVPAARHFYLSEALNLATVRDLVADASSLVLVQFKVGPSELLVEILFSICVHQQLVKVVCDAATVLDLTDHIPHSLPGRPSRLLGIYFQ